MASIFGQTRFIRAKSSGDQPAVRLFDQFESGGTQEVLTVSAVGTFVLGALLERRPVVRHKPGSYDSVAFRAAVLLWCSSPAPPAAKPRCDNPHKFIYRRNCNYPDVAIAAIPVR
jgi:hypothetical protein